jgi:hypothetical protein
MMPKSIFDEARMPASVNKEFLENLWRDTVSEILGDLTVRVRSLEGAGADPTPDEFCFTDSSGDCVSEDPRCMHQPIEDVLPEAEIYIMQLESEVEQLREQIAILEEECDDLRKEIEISDDVVYEIVNVLKNNDVI